MTAICREYWTVDIPSDLSENEEERGQLAFMQAEEKSRYWKIPAIWNTVWDNGEQVRVCRKSHRVS